VEDDRLRLIFTCCHPALSPEARVALTLRLLGGLTVAEVAQAFLVPETTMAQRITRAKAKIRDARIPYRVPAETDLSDRLSDVLAVLFLVSNEGYLASGGDQPIRDELTGEAITPPAPTCCAASAAATRRAPRTTPRSRPRKTTPSAATSDGVATSSAAETGQGVSRGRCAARERSTSLRSPVDTPAPIVVCLAQDDPTPAAASTEGDLHERDGDRRGQA